MRRRYSISLPVVRLTPLTGPSDSVVRRIRFPLRLLGKSSDGGVKGGMAGNYGQAMKALRAPRHVLKFCASRSQNEAVMAGDVQPPDDPWRWCRNAEMGVARCSCHCAGRGHVGRGDYLGRRPAPPPFLLALDASSCIPRDAGPVAVRDDSRVHQSMQLCGDPELKVCLSRFRSRPCGQGARPPWTLVQPLSAWRATLQYQVGGSKMLIRPSSPLRLPLPRRIYM